MIFSELKLNSTTLKNPKTVNYRIYQNNYVLCIQSNASKLNPFIREKENENADP